MKKIAIIGAGNMGGAIARGLLAAGGYRVSVANPSPGKLQAIKAEYPQAEVTVDNAEAAAGADVVILAVKPWLVKEVLGSVEPAIDLGRVTLVSLAAGVTAADLAAMTSSPDLAAKAIVRVMPNTAISVGQSMTVACGDDAEPERLDQVAAMMSAMGRAAVLPERLMNGAMALCSCGIAYAFRYIRAAVEGAVELGLRPDQAKEYVGQTIRGAVAILEASGANPESEIDRVTTPGGVTIKGLNAMERYGFTTAVIEGLKASAR